MCLSCWNCRLIRDDIISKWIRKYRLHYVVSRSTVCCCYDPGAVLASEEIPLEPLFPCESGHICQVSIERSQHEPLHAEQPGIILLDLF